MGLVVYLAFGLGAGLAALRAARLRSASGLAVWGIIGGLCLLVAAVRVVSQTNPVHSAVWLITVFLCMAVLFIMRRAEFLAAGQVLIYAGAIMVLYVFIIVFVEIDTLVEEPAPTWMTVGAIGVAAALLLALTPIALSLRPEEPTGVAIPGYGSVENIGEAIYFGATIPLEAASLILLVALVGATAIGKAGRES